MIFALGGSLFLFLSLLFISNFPPLLAPFQGQEEMKAANPKESWKVNQELLKLSFLSLDPLEPHTNGKPLAERDLTEAAFRIDRRSLLEPIELAPKNGRPEVTLSCLWQIFFICMKSVRTATTVVACGVVGYRVRSPITKISNTCRLKKMIYHGAWTTLEEDRTLLAFFSRAAHRLMSQIYHS